MKKDPCSIDPARGKCEAQRLLDRITGGRRLSRVEMNAAVGVVDVEMVCA